MLALTNPNLIHATAVVEPVVDWVSLDEVAKATTLVPQTTAQERKTAEVEAQAQTAVELMKLRSRLFRTPSAYFDAFASPILFLRAPGRDTPLTKTAAMVNEPVMLQEAEDEESTYGDAFGPYDDDLHYQLPNNDGRRASEEPLDSSTNSPSEPDDHHSIQGSDVEGLLKQPPRRRKVLRRWPPHTRPELVKLPYTKVFVRDSATTPPHGHALLMRAQGTELVELMRRACFFGQEKSVAEARVGLSVFDRTEGEHSPEVDTGLVAAVEWLKGL